MRALGNKAKKVKRESYNKIASDAVSPNGGVQPFGFDKTANTILSSNQKKKKFRL